jgi:hypothetical protein
VTVCLYFETLIFTWFLLVVISAGFQNNMYVYVGQANMYIKISFVSFSTSPILTVDHISTHFKCTLYIHVLLTLSHVVVLLTLDHGAFLIFRCRP